jgi:Histidine kinase-like ATPase domain
MMPSGEIKIIDVPLPRSRHCGAFARRVLEANLQTHVRPSCLADATLVVSELANNAYEHGEGNIRLRVWIREDRVRFAISDEGQVSVAKIRAKPDESHSYGLQVVQRVSLQWGAREQPTLVWAEISRLPATELAGARATDPWARRRPSWPAPQRPIWPAPYVLSPKRGLPLRQGTGVKTTNIVVSTHTLPPARAGAGSTRSTILPTIGQKSNSVISKNLS